MMACAKIKFKKVSLDDFDDIMSIRRQDETLNGYDYLPDYYSLLITSPVAKGFAAIIGEEWVGFCLGYVCDDGKTIVTRAGRVSKHHEGKGVYRALDNYVRQQFGEHVTTHVMSFNEQNSSMMRNIKNGYYNLISKRETTHFKLQRNINSEFKEREPGISDITRNVSTMDMMKIFKNTDECLDLFPENIIICNYVPFMLLESNIPLMYFDRSMFIGTFTPKCVLLTCGTFFRVGHCVVLILDVYGKTELCFVDHLILHLKRLSNEIYAEEIEVWIINENRKSLENDPIYRAMTLYGFKKENRHPNTLLCAGKQTTDIKC